MIQLILFFVFSGFAILLQGSVVTAPLVLGVLIAFTVVRKKLWILSLAFVCGLIVDIVTLRNLGLESIYFLLVIALVFLYERKFETATKEFVGIFSFLVTVVYCFLFPSSGVLIPAIGTSLVGIGSFSLFRLLK